MGKIIKAFSVTALLASALVTQAAFAQGTCAIDPLAGHAGAKATSRFGVWRPYYNGGKGGGHAGQDLRAAAGTKLYSPVAGTIAGIRVQPKGAGNYLIIKRRDNGDLIWLMHLQGYAPGIVEGKEVAAGDFVAISGASGGNYAPHLHLEYTTTRRNDVRNIWVRKGMQREAIFKAENNYRAKGNGTYVTDPAGFMCTAYEFVGGAAADNAVLGKDTKEQYQILYGARPNGGVPPNTGYTDRQEASANSTAIKAQAEGKTVVEFLSDKDGYGTLSGDRVAAKEDESPSEMLARESKRRMIDAEWQKNVTLVSSRALWADYLQTVAVSNYMQEAIYRKREKVEALMATLTAQELEKKRRVVDAARASALRQAATKALN